ncbi:MAG: CHAT domain-containing protein [Kofleriaceae bacterium]
MLPLLAMRLATVVLLVVALFTASAAAQVAPKPPSLKVQQEISTLEKELLDLTMKQAPFKAVKVAKKLYDLRMKELGADAPQTRNTMFQYAGLLVQTGDYNTGYAVYKANLVALEKKHGPESTEVQQALMMLIGPLWAQNRLDELDPIYQRQLALSKKLDGDQSREYASALTQYGSLLNARNEYTAAIRLYEQALKITEATAKDDMSLIGALQIVASTYWQMGQKPKAIALFDRIVKLANGMAATNLQYAAAMLWSVASQYSYGGRPDLAAPLQKQVNDMYMKEIARMEKATPDDPMLPGLVSQLGFSYRNAQDLANAEKWLEKAIAMQKKKGSFSGLGGSLAEIKRAQGKLPEALKLYEDAGKELAALAPQSANAYDSTIAEVLREMGEFKRAEAILVKALPVTEKQYGKNHPMYGYGQLALAKIYMGAKQIAKAEHALTTALDLAERDLANVLKTGTEADHAVYFGRNSYQLDTAMNYVLLYAPKNPSAARLGLTTLLRRKGRTLDAAAASMSTIRAKLSPEDKKLLDELANARAQLAKLTVAGPTATGPESYAKEIAALEDQVQKLELAVGKKSAAYRAATQSITLAAVQKEIPAKAKLVEIVNYQPYDPNSPYAVNPVMKPRRFAAFVVGAKGEPALIELGEARPIEDAIEKFRKALADPNNKQVTVLGRALFDLTMAKIAPALGGSTEILIAPDGALNVVPFSALVDANSKFLLETYNFTYLTSGRDLTRLAVRTKSQGGGVMFADPSFDATQKAQKPDGADGARPTRGRRSSDLASLMWPPLPGTAKEADEVEKKMKLVVYRKDQATETTLKKVRGPRVLHLATHGFFLPDEPPPVVKEGESRAMPAQGPVPSQENPLLRSGLAFAGANKLESGADDGILTAMEATGLDLWGTKLVVLSACETGVGKVTNGDGVYGLRRALVIAGAESLVMSLWQVDDEATKELMVGYYTKLGANKGRSSALRETQLEIAGRKGFAHPFYWASFVPAGVNEPLGN